MSTETWAGVKGLEAERFGFRSLDDLPDVNSQTVKKYFISLTIAMFTDR